MIYRQNKHAASRTIEGQAFIITPDDNKMHTLNRTAAEVWARAKEGCTIDQAASHLAERFRVDESTAAADVKQCVDDLVARGILVTE